jgi:hypothetical protein
MVSNLIKESVHRYAFITFFPDKAVPYNQETHGLAVRTLLENTVLIL